MSKQKQKEQIDISTLPEVITCITSILLDFKNNDRRLKLIESMLKTPEKTLKLLSREEIIQFAKEQKIYIDPAEGKKPNKNEPAPEHKEITAKELAKAFKLKISEESIAFKKKKKNLLDNIEQLKKQKEESIEYYKNPPQIDPKNKGKEKKPPLPEEIIIPVLNEYEFDYLPIVYNYPLNEEELKEIDKENILLNNVIIVNEGEDVIAIEENNDDPKKKKPAAMLLLFIKKIIRMKIF